MSTPMALLSSSPPATLLNSADNDSESNRRQSGHHHQFRPRIHSGLSPFLSTANSRPLSISGSLHSDVNEFSSVPSLFYDRDLSRGVSTSSSGQFPGIPSSSSGIKAFSCTISSPAEITQRNNHHQIHSHRHASSVPSCRTQPAESRRPALQMIGFQVQGEKTMKFDLDCGLQKPRNESYTLDTEKAAFLGAHRQLDEIAEEIRFLSQTDLSSIGKIDSDLDESEAVMDDTLLEQASAEYEVFLDPVVKKAFDVAASAHKGQLRKDGSPYISHCMQTAIILAKCGSSADIVAAGLLHDVIDDSAMDSEQLKGLFGSELTEMVEGVSKLSLFSQLARDHRMARDPKQADRLHSMFLSMADPRVALIKLADRIHNLRTLDALSSEKRHRIAEESLKIFAPLANRLGTWSLKAELEDLCFKHLKPEEYKNLSQKLLMANGTGQQILAAAVRKLHDSLLNTNVGVVDLSGRPKSLFGIHSKMIKKNYSVERILDIRGIRLIVEDEKSCYEALNVVHRIWTNSSEHFKDYIKNPKDNGYQSLHTVVQDEFGNSIEVQIRSKAMHQHAEYGVAAHWHYKESGPPGSTEPDSQDSSMTRLRVAWARYVLSWVAELADLKVRVTPATESMRPPCPFPVHEEGCPFAKFGTVHLDHACQSSHGHGVHREMNDEPVFVVVKANDQMIIEQLPAKSTVSSYLKSHLDPQKHSLESTGTRKSWKVMINDRVVYDHEMRLKMGDVLHLVEVEDIFDGLDFDEGAEDAEESYWEKMLPTNAIPLLESRNWWEMQESALKMAALSSMDDLSNRSSRWVVAESGHN